MQTKVGDFLTYGLIILLSASLALGVINPFSEYSDSGEASESIITSVIIVLSVFFLFIRRIFTGRIRVSFPKWFRYLLLFFVIYLISTVIHDRGSSSTMVTHFLKLFLDLLLCYLLYDLFRNGNRIKSISILSYSLATALLGVLYYLGLLDPYIMVSSGRMMIFGENPNSTSARIMIGIILLIYTLLSNPFQWRKWRYLLAIFIIPELLMVIASGSRGSFLILIICFIILLLNETKTTLQRFSVVVGILAVGFFALNKLTNVAIQENFSMFERLSDLEEGEDAGRSSLNKDAIQIFMDYPIIGCGATAFPDEMRIRFQEQRTVHNLFYYILVTSGLIGFTPFVLFLILCFKIAIRPYNRDLNISILLIILLLAWKTGGILTYAIMWYLFSILLSSSTNKTIQNKLI